MITNTCILNFLNISKINHTMTMKQKSIMAFVLGAILVLTVSSIDSVFADYDKDDDRYDDDKDGDDKSEREERTS